MNNLLDILNKSVNYLEKKNIKNARLTAESIISEVLEMAGGLSTKADFFLIQKNINLSRIVFDGEKIYFPFQNLFLNTLATEKRYNEEDFHAIVIFCFCYNIIY